MSKKPRHKFIVPDEFMIPVGATGTALLERCADTWTDSDIELLRAQLPQQFHAVPTDALRTRWINIRKRGTPGYRLNGHGPTRSWNPGLRKVAIDAYGSW